MKRLFPILFIAIFTFAGCAAPTPPPSTATPAPSNTPMPSPTITLTFTPAPTRTNTPTRTPTFTPTQVTPIFTAVPSDEVVGLDSELVELHRLGGHSTAVTALAFSPDGSLLASADFDGSVQVWNVSDGNLLYTLSQETNVYSMAFSPDGNTLAVGLRPGSIKLWDVGTGTLMRTLEGEFAYVYGVAFTPDGGTLAAARQDGVAQLWQVSDGTLLHELPKQDSFQLRGGAISADGRVLALMSVSQNVHLWEINAEPHLLRTITASGLLSDAALSPDGAALAVGTMLGNQIELFETGSGSPLQVLSPVLAPLDMEFNAEGTTLTSVGLDNKITVWDLNAGTLLDEFQAEKQATTIAEISPDGRLVAFGNDRGEVTLWQLP